MMSRLWLIQSFDFLTSQCAWHNWWYQRGRNQSCCNPPLQQELQRVFRVAHPRASKFTPRSDKQCPPHRSLSLCKTRVITRLITECSIDSINVAERDEVISVFESKTSQVHSAHSWEFLGNPATEHRQEIELESDVIVASIDTGLNIQQFLSLFQNVRKYLYNAYTISDSWCYFFNPGIWPESESFNDAGIGPAPKRFKGECVTGENFTLANCNRWRARAHTHEKNCEIYVPFSLLMTSVGDLFLQKNHWCPVLLQRVRDWIRSPWV